MSTKMTINYDTIMQGLEDAVDARREQAIWCAAEGVTLLKEFRTVGLMTPRQCGRTLAAITRLVKNERSIMIVHDHSMRNLMAEAYARHSGLDMSPSTEARIYTTKEVLTAMKTVQKGNQDILLANANEIMVDDALYFFENIRRNQFYKWLHDRAGDEQIIWLLG